MRDVSAFFCGILLVPALAATAPPAEQALFSEVTSKLAADPSMAKYPAGTYLTPEITPGGIALIDFDHDGRLDILAVCHPPPAGAAGLAASAPCRLFRQMEEA